MCASLTCSRLLRLLLVVALGLSPVALLPGAAHAADISISGTITGTPYGAGTADPQQGVTVGLFLEGSYAAPIATDTTDAEGAYAFADLAPRSVQGPGSRRRRSRRRGTPATSILRTRPR